MLLVSWISIFSIIQYWKMSKMLSHTVLIPIKLEVAFYLPQTNKKALQIYICCWKCSHTHFEYIPNLLEGGFFFLAQFHTDICKSIIRICYLVHYVQKSRLSSVSKASSVGF